jgi:hypothetical protein
VIFADRMAQDYYIKLSPLPQDGRAGKASPFFQWKKKDALSRLNPVGN